MAAKKTTPSTDTPKTAPAAAKKAPAKKAAAKKAAPAKPEAPAKNQTPAKKTDLKKATVTAAPSITIHAPASYDEIAQTAFLIYRARKEKGLPGDQHGDWLEAERRLKGK